MTTIIKTITEEEAEELIATNKERYKVAKQLEPLVFRQDALSPAEETERDRLLTEFKKLNARVEALEAKRTDWFRALINHLTK